MIAKLSLKAQVLQVTMSAMGKRTVQVNIRMTPEDLAAMKKAADTLWPRAVLSNAGIVLGLARIAADDTLKKKSRKS